MPSSRAPRGSPPTMPVFLAMHERSMAQWAPFDAKSWGFSDAGLMGMVAAAPHLNMFMFFVQFEGAFPTVLVDPGSSQGAVAAVSNVMSCAFPGCPPNPPFPF